MKPYLLNNYRNGNVDVKIYSDGTTTRECEGEPQPEYPCSVDLKVTDFCDAGCEFCHEMSTGAGKHAIPNTVYNALKGAPSGIEIAIGGGDPFLFPGLNSLLLQCKECNWISNITVNIQHINRWRTRIQKLRKDRLIYGLGVSWSPDYHQDILDQIENTDWTDIIDDNTIIHFIAGINTIEEVEDIIRSGIKKVLILGYKKWGRGIEFYSPKIENILSRWRYFVGRLLTRQNVIVSFDNLALEQLGVKQRVPDDIWKKKYMGDDGTFTMYIDAVTDSFAKTSTCERIPRNGMSLKEMFKYVRHGSDIIVPAG